MAESTNVSVEIIKPGKEGERLSCSLNVEINSEDNNDKSSFLPGQPGIARIFAGSNIENLSVTNTNGTAALLDSKQLLLGATEDLYLTFSGSTTSSVSYPIISLVSSEIVGSFYDAEGSPCYPSFKISSDNSSIVASEKCYGVIKIQYITSYTRCVFALGGDDDGLLMAMGDCGTEKIFATVNIPAYKEGDDDDEEEEEKACGLTLEFNPDDNDGSSSIEVGDSGTVRLYKGEDVSVNKAVNTNGTISISGYNLTGVIGDLSPSADDEDKLYVSFSGSKTASLQYRCASGFSYTIQGSFYDSLGNKVNPSFSASGTTVTANVKCLGVLLVSYTTQYDTYSFGANDPGSVVLGAFGTCGTKNVYDSVEVTVNAEGTDDDGSDASDSISMAIDVTLVYKDFVSGDRISGAQIKLDGSPKGETDDNGEIILKGLKTHTRYNIVATKEGYLDTDSDSLSNDSFYIST